MRNWSVIFRTIAAVALLARGASARGAATETDLVAQAAFQVPAPCPSRVLLTPLVEQRLELNAQKVVEKLIATGWMREVTDFLLANPIRLSRTKVQMTFTFALP